MLCTGPARLADIVVLAVAVHPFTSVTVTEYVPAERPLNDAVVAPFDHKYVYGDTPPLVILTDAVPLLKEGHVPSVDDADTIRAHGAEQADAGWKPSFVIPPRSVPANKYGV